MKITGAQIRAARALLGVQIRDVSKKTMISTGALVRVERDSRVHDRTRAVVRELLEQLGVEFIPGGVRLREMGDAAE